ncbi:TlpA family protein disulfide reductase [Halobiforma nitratireducens]|uniref:Alkyl hydroperoxide reductase/ thiol specific antioxidant/ Mal allergen n=1 Tax=Halobiforma nitratireducens JCM 10879 TaxID=1227454 RepID=M0M4W1_9EURY|nr:redoxin domain-containing protein [Halobiforma nitratireducens]EMA39659.1 alkyl hydroperoxide reductase/ thiol specific antioxidant/ Mal allergen [Halobiforma nitratireducens JCM 10879]
MNRRELVAGIASLSALGGAVAVLRRGLPAADGPRSGSDTASEPNADGTSIAGDEPIEVETIDAQGSESGTLPVPNDGITVVTFFSVTCTQCERMLSPLADAHERLTSEYGDAVTFVSLFPPTPEPDLREWWREHEGNWSLGFDPAGRLATRYRVAGTVLLVIDADGENHWRTDRVLESDRYVRRLESIFEEHLKDETIGPDRGEDEATDGNEHESDDKNESERDLERNGEREGENDA